MASQKPKASS